MGDRKLKTMMEDTFEEMKENLIVQMSKAEVVCLTTDAWSARRRGYLGVTAHWLDSDLKRHSAALACKRLKGTNFYNSRCFLVII